MSFATYPSLKGTTVFVTGGAAGIGEYLVRAFAEQGSRVGFVDIDAARGQALADEVGGAVRFAACDLRDIKALKAAFAALKAKVGPAAVLVNNAARDDRHGWADVTPEYYDERIATNLRHMFFATQAVAPDMVAAGRGSIVNMGSNSWWEAGGGMPVYTTAKAARARHDAKLRPRPRPAPHPRQHRGAGLGDDRAPEAALGHPGEARRPAETPVPARSDRPRSISPAWCCSWHPTTAPCAPPTTSWSKAARSDTGASSDWNWKRSIVGHLERIEDATRAMDPPRLSGSPGGRRAAIRPERDAFDFSDLETGYGPDLSPAASPDPEGERRRSPHPRAARGAARRSRGRPGPGNLAIAAPGRRGRGAGRTRRFRNAGRRFAVGGETRPAARPVALVDVPRRRHRGQNRDGGAARRLRGDLDDLARQIHAALRRPAPRRPGPGRPGTGRQSGRRRPRRRSRPRPGRGAGSRPPSTRCRAPARCRPRALRSAPRCRCSASRPAAPAP